LNEGDMSWSLKGELQWQRAKRRLGCIENEYI
jgi:hypothetical protein